MSRLDDLFEGRNKTLTVNEVAELLGFTPKGVYRWIRTGVIPAYKVAGTWFVLRDDLRDVLAQGSNLSPDTRPPD